VVSFNFAQKYIKTGGYTTKLRKDFTPEKCNRTNLFVKGDAVAINKQICFIVATG
jgi:hypothetical protein